MSDWRAELEGDLARDVAGLDRALGVALSARAYVDALLDPRGHLFQRLEYVGDSILDAVVVRALVLRTPWHEADLSAVSGAQQALVSDHALGRVAARRGLPAVRAFDASPHRLADRVEAAIGAAWADAGIAVAEAVAERLVIVPALGAVRSLAGVPGSVGDARYEGASRACGHAPRTRAWYGAAAADGSARRRLAMVGNAVVEASCATAQYVDVPGATEAAMSESRREMTANAELARRAYDLGLVPTRGARDDRSVADAVQALVGAATMDGGTDAGLRVASSVLRVRYAPGPVPVAPGGDEPRGTTPAPESLT